MKKLGVIMAMAMIVMLVFQFSAFASKTFLCTGGIFKKSIADFSDECVLYVRYETNISHAGCSGYAKTCYHSAQSAGYATGQTPKIGAIAVFDTWTTSKGYVVEAGHVGIVADKRNNNQEIKLRHSNWHLDRKVSEEWINVNNYPILGYIYCDGNGDDSNAVSKVFRIVGETGWYPPIKTCINADEWVRIIDGRAVQSFGSNDICYTEYIRNSGFQNVLIGTGDLPQECTQ